MVIVEEKQEIEAPSILIVSSDPKLLTFARSNLPRFGYRLVQMRDTGERLKDVLNDLKPALVIVDAVAPAMIGVPVSLRVRQWSSVPTILLTSWQAGENKVRGIDVNSTNGLTAPLGIDELLQWASPALNLN